jgi:hypothetical protein
MLAAGCWLLAVAEEFLRLYDHMVHACSRRLDEIKKCWPTPEFGTVRATTTFGARDRWHTNSFAADPGFGSSFIDMAKQLSGRLHPCVPLL